MRHRKILQYLYSLESPVIKLGVDRIQNLLDKIGNPERNLKCIHVAGTNGKGSVCSMIFHALKEAGCKVGLYTSPHLKRFNERIRVNESLITDKELVEYFLKIKPHITSQSFFEITTAMAFLHFKEKNVDFAVMEVGLGGRLDATNVIVPLVSVITNVGFEHTDILGNTIERIAFEKAGIIKISVPVVTGAEGKALAVLKKIARERNAPLFLQGKHRRIKFKYLKGEFQQNNKDTALTTLEILKKYHKIEINDKTIIKGIEKTEWHGRFQFLSKHVLIDCAHNPDGMKLLVNELKKLKFKEFIFVAGFSQDKDVKGILKIIQPLTSSIIFTKSKNEKASNPAQLLRAFNSLNKKNKINKLIIKNPKKALNYAKKISKKEDLIVVCGSIYMVGEVL